MLRAERESSFLKGFSPRLVCSVIATGPEMCKEKGVCSPMSAPTLRQLAACAYGSMAPRKWTQAQMNERESLWRLWSGLILTMLFCAYELRNRGA